MPGEPGWLIRPAARGDLTTIWQHGATEWGEVRADGYLQALFALFDLLAAFPAMARLRAELSPPVHVHPHGAHLVIYRPFAGAVPRIEIIRILHAHQDLTLWLAEG